MKFNELKFFENARKKHLKPDEFPIYDAIPDAEVRKKLNESVDYGKNPRFSAALDEICANIVGRTMFKLLITKTSAHKQTMQILEHTVEKYGSYYSENVVYINLNRYEADGSGKTYKQYYGIIKKEEVQPKLKSLAGSMFHEFCHALHHISGTRMKHKIYNICASPELREVWGEDEEFRTINCHRGDPICDHCFDLVQSILKIKLFLPRCSHNIGYRSKNDAEDHPNRQFLLQHFLKHKDQLEGWREYAL
jgi:hypothetical protein